MGGARDSMIALAEIPIHIMIIDLPASAIGCMSVMICGCSCLPNVHMQSHGWGSMHANVRISGLPCCHGVRRVDHIGWSWLCWDRSTLGFDEKIRSALGSTGGYARVSRKLDSPFDACRPHREFFLSNCDTCFCF